MAEANGDGATRSDDTEASEENETNGSLIISLKLLITNLLYLHYLNFLLQEFLQALLITALLRDHFVNFVVARHFVVAHALFFYRSK